MIGCDDCDGCFGLVIGIGCDERGCDCCVARSLNWIGVFDDGNFLEYRYVDGFG